MDVRLIGIILIILNFILVIGSLVILLLYVLRIRPFKKRKKGQIDLSKSDKQIHNKITIRNSIYFVIITSIISFLLWFIEPIMIALFNLKEYSSGIELGYTFFVIGVNLTVYYFVLKETLKRIDKKAIEFDKNRICIWFFFVTGIVNFMAELLIGATFSIITKVPLSEAEFSQPFGLLPAIVAIYLSSKYKRKKNNEKTEILTKTTKY